MEDATSNITTGEIVEVLSATKTALRDTYDAAGKVTYVYSMNNSGATTYNNLQWEDDLGAYALASGLDVVPLTYVEDSLQYYVNGVLQPVPQITATNPLQVSGISVPTNGNAMLIYEADINTYAPLEVGSLITNTAVLSDTNRITPVSASETITIEETPVLSISKAFSPTTVTENGQVTYTFTIQNTGNIEADEQANVVVSDLFNPVLNNIEVTYNTGTLPTTSHSYDEETGLFSTNNGVITVPAASFTQSDTEEWQNTPGVITISVTGTI